MRSRLHALAVVISLIVILTNARTKEAGAPSGSCITAPAGMTSWWPGDGNANDIVGNHPGTLVNNPTFAPGMVSQAFSFDGVDDVVTTTLMLDYDGGVSFDAWIKTTDEGALIIADGGGASANRGMGLFIEPVTPTPAVDTVPQGKIALFGSKGTNEWNFFLVGPVINDGQFHHVAATWSGKADANGVALYVDGQVISRAAAKQSIGKVSVPINIGWHTTIPAYRQFRGLIDEVEIFNRRLSDSDVANIFNAGSQGKCRSTL
jgi:hypothetical protein